jgi:phage terminase large subunit-like protein
MQPAQSQLESIPFQYAAAVRSGEITVGKKIKLAVERFYQWIETAEADGYHLDHATGMFAVTFFENFLNHTEGKMAGKPFVLAPFQQFTIYNVFGWKDATGKRRIKTIYDKRAKKNGKTAEMAGVALYCMSFDEEIKAQVFIGATKEEQARLCWNAAKDFIDSFVANTRLKQLGFRTMQNKVIFEPTNSFLRPLGGDSKTQDGINSHLSIIDEYHAHATDGVKENLESSAVQRLQPLTWHITTAGTNIASVCKNYEDSVIEVLEGRKKDDRLWIMIHDLDEDDDWNDETKWIKANPLLNQGLSIDNIRDEYLKCVNQPSKIPNFKTKHLNMWVDAPKIWIPTEIWQKNKISEIPLSKFQKYGSYAALDLSTTTDLTAFAILSEPDEHEKRYLKVLLFCPEKTIERRSKEDRVPYKYWADAGFIIATPGDVVDHAVVEDRIRIEYHKHAVKRIEIDRYLATNITSNLQEEGFEVAYFTQTITNYSFPTKEFERLVYLNKIIHDGNPVLEWMLSGCVVISDTNENIRISKSRSHAGGKRIDGIIASIMALGGSLSPKEEKSKYEKPMDESEIYI